MNNLHEIRNKWSWEEIMEREYIELKNGNVDDWLESIFSKQKHPNDFYDVAHSQLMYQHICQIKEIVNIIIEKIKRREFNSRKQVDTIEKNKDKFHDILSRECYNTFGKDIEYKLINFQYRL